MHIWVHVGWNADVDNLSHQVTLARIWQRADEGVAAIAHYWFFFRNGAARIEVWRQHVRIATAVESGLGCLRRLGRATGD